MPTYVYECQACEQVFEADQRITEEPLSTCARCDGGPVKRLIQPPAILFKGPGFYVTDSAAKPSEPAAKTETPAPAPTSDNTAKGDD